MTRLILILLIIFIVLTILRSFLRRFRAGSITKNKPPQNPGTHKEKKSGDDIEDAKFEEIK